MNPRRLLYVFAALAILLEFQNCTQFAPASLWNQAKSESSLSAVPQPSPAPIPAPGPQPVTLAGRYFALAESATVGDTSEVLALASVRLNEDYSLSGTFWFEDASNTNYVTLSKMRQAMTPDFTPDCQPTAFLGPGILANPQPASGQWAFDGTTLTISFPNITSTWIRVPSISTDAWYLESVTGYGTLVGFGFDEADDPMAFAGPVTDAMLASNTSGKEYQNNTGTAQGTWVPWAYDTGWPGYPATADPDVRQQTNLINDGYSVYGWYQIARNIPGLPANMLVDNFSHDFNGDGCADEPGHSRVIFGIFRAAGMDRTLVIESDGADTGALPILSLGWSIF